MIYCHSFPIFLFFNDTATTEIYTLSLHDALPISLSRPRWLGGRLRPWAEAAPDRPPQGAGQVLPAADRQAVAQQTRHAGDRRPWAAQGQVAELAGEQEQQRGQSGPGGPVDRGGPQRVVDGQLTGGGDWLPA